MSLITTGPRGLGFCFKASLYCPQVPRERRNSWDFLKVGHPWVESVLLKVCLESHGKIKPFLNRTALGSVPRSIQHILRDPDSQLPTQRYTRTSKFVHASDTPTGRLTEDPTPSVPFVRFPPLWVPPEKCRFSYCAFRLKCPSTSSQTLLGETQYLVHTFLALLLGVPLLLSAEIEGEGIFSRWYDAPSTTL